MFIIIYIATSTVSIDVQNRSKASTRKSRAEINCTILLHRTIVVSKYFVNRYSHNTIQQSIRHATLQCSWLDTQAYLLHHHQTS